MRFRTPVALAAVLALTLAATAAVGAEDTTSEPSLAATKVSDADRVDGKHAISATSTRWKRKSKLVAANSNGYLPSNIVKPYWKLIKDKPAGFADGKDDVGYARDIVVTVQTTRDSAFDVSVDFDPSFDVNLTAIPVDVGEIIYHNANVLVERLASGKLRHTMRLGDQNATETTIDVRVRAFKPGASVSELKTALAEANPQVRKRS